MASVRAILALKLGTCRFAGWNSPCQNQLRRGMRKGLHLGAQQQNSSSGQAVHSCRDQWPPLRRWRLRLRAASSHVTADSSQGIFYSDIGADRASELRKDAAWLAAAFTQKESLVVVLSDNQSLVRDRRAVLLSTSAVQAPDGDDPVHPMFLGVSTSNGAAIFAVDLKKVSLTGAIQRELDNGAQWMDLRKYGPQLEASEAGLLAYARGMVEWHFRNRFCGQCGSKVVSQEGGHCLKCTSEQCGKLAYPRMDPAVIMLITVGNFVLLGRQARWDPGRYSVLAGFLEIGESFEKAVAREVKEETGVTIEESSLRYVGSQPWPFPSTVMVGYTGTARKRHVERVPHGHVPAVHLPEADEVKFLPSLRADGSELEDARWIHKSFLRSVILGNSSPQGQKFSLPGNYSIAGLLLRTWAAEDDVSIPQWSGGDVSTVDIDEGVFKYVLIRVKDANGNQKMIVRGAKAFAYHSDILAATRTALARKGLQVEQCGGGRIEHQPANHLLNVFSNSQAYGQADHEVTRALLLQSYPLYSINLP